MLGAYSVHAKKKVITVLDSLVYEEILTKSTGTQFCNSISFLGIFPTEQNHFTTFCMCIKKKTGLFQLLGNDF